MKVVASQQVITRPEVFKTIKPGFQNFGKDVEINTRGQLVTQSAKAKELKKSFGLENGFKDIGYQNISKKTEIELQNIDQKDEKESKFGFQNIIKNAEVKGNKSVNPPGQLVSQNIDQKGRSIDTLA